MLLIGKSICSKNAGSIIDEINSVVGKWDDYAEKVNVSQSLREAISKTLINID